MDVTSAAVPPGHPGEPAGRERVQKALNALFCLVAVAGIGVSVWAIVMQVADLRARSESRERIAAGCGGLVDPELVLGLNGGTDRVELSDRHHVSTARRVSNCLVHRVGDPGTTYGHFALTLTMYPADPKADERRIALDDEPFELRRGGVDDITAAADRAVPHPLGDGRLGEYESHMVTARALCADDGALSSVEASAVAKYADVARPEDRRTLAGLARQAVERAAEERGCRAGLPALPAEFPEPAFALRPAAGAGGTCAWYGRLIAAEGRGSLPDRALAAPAGTASAHDACLLALGEDGTRRIWPAYEKTTERPRDLGTVLSLSPLWLRTETLVGDGTRGVRTGLRDRTEIRPGTAGSDEFTWWASSVCDGRPALHLMQVSYPYDRILRDRLEPLFRAYVDDATGRRGCTSPVLPEASDFERS
ncbi:MAG TPA: hypothetical protein VN520_37345 [Streptomyces sp.]|uniref:hypothetical protein n=1 Tax=Streptomyces sp. TaxID=1931 RepID=UPI002C9D2E32|nr:hypothetical protein [Streptomyces sp.]HWU11952.1 hypothetical protein [Streptomyces sp.]